MLSHHQEVTVGFELNDARLAKVARSIERSKARLNQTEIFINLEPIQNTDATEKALWEAQVKKLLYRRDTGAMKKSFPSLEDALKRNARRLEKEEKRREAEKQKIKVSDGTDFYKSSLKAAEFAAEKAKSHAFGSKIEGEVLKTIHNYSGCNSIYTKERVLVRKDGHGFTYTSSLPPWISSSTYANADSAFKTRPEAFQVAFKAPSREPGKTAEEIKEFRIARLKKFQMFAQRRNEALKSGNDSPTTATSPDGNFNFPPVSPLASPRSIEDNSKSGFLSSDNLDFSHIHGESVTLSNSQRTPSVAKKKTSLRYKPKDFTFDALSMCDIRSKKSPIITLDDNDISYEEESAEREEKVIDTAVTKSKKLSRSASTPISHSFPISLKISSVEEASLALETRDKAIQAAALRKAAEEKALAKAKKAEEDAARKAAALALAAAEAAREAALLAAKEEEVAQALALAQAEAEAAELEAKQQTVEDMGASDQAEITVGAMLESEIQSQVIEPNSDSYGVEVPEEALNEEPRWSVSGIFNTFEQEKEEDKSPWWTSGENFVSGYAEENPQQLEEMGIDGGNILETTTTDDAAVQGVDMPSSQQALEVQTDEVVQGEVQGPSSVSSSKNSPSKSSKLSKKKKVIDEGPKIDLNKYRVQKLVSHRNDRVDLRKIECSKTFDRLESLGLDVKTVPIPTNILTDEKAVDDFLAQWRKEQEVYSPSKPATAKYLGKLIPIKPVEVSDILLPMRRSSDDAYAIVDSIVGSGEVTSVDRPESRPDSRLFPSQVENVTEDDMRCYVESINLQTLPLPKTVTDYLAELDAETIEIMSGTKSPKKGKWAQSEAEEAEQRSLEEEKASVAASIESEKSQMQRRRYLMA